MVNPDKEEAATSDAAGEDAAARQAAEIAVELTEAGDAVLGAAPDADAAAGQPRSRRTITGALTAAGSGVARRSSATAAAAGRGSRAAGRGSRTALTWLTGQVVAMGPRLRIRDQATLRAQFPGRDDQEIAGLLIDRAARAAAAVGGATGAWSTLPVLPAFPAEIAAETLAVVGIEIKLVGELHEILGAPAQGSATERARAYIGAWAHRRGVYAVPGGLLLVAGSPLARQLRRRLAGRAGRSAFSLGPLLTGAFAGAMINRRETRKLGKDILEDLRRHQDELTARG
jgi:hypothetical protein